MKAALLTVLIFAWSLYLQSEMELPGASDLIATISEDGKRALTASMFKGPATLWDLQSETELLTLPTGSRGIAAIAMSSDGKWAAASFWRDPTIKIWNLDQKQSPREIKYQQKTSLSLALSADGQLLIAADGSQRAAIFDLSKANPVPQYLDHPLLQKMITHRNLAHKIKKPFSKHETTKMNAVLSLDGLRALTTYQKHARVWDIRTRTLLREFYIGKEISAVAASNKGTKIIIGTETGQVEVYDLETPDYPILRSKKHLYEIRSVALSGDGNLALFSTAFGVFILTENCESQIVAQRGTNPFAITSDGEKMIRGGWENSVYFSKLPLFEHKCF